MKVKLHFYGHLIEKIGSDTIELVADSARDAINQLCRLYPKLKAPVTVGRYRIKIDGLKTVEQLNGPLLDEELHLRPFEGFAGGDGIMQIIVGVVLIVVGALMLFLGIPGGEFVIKLGIAFVIGGITTLLFPAPTMETSDTSDPEGSKYVGAHQNTVAVGTRIALGYGLYRVGGHYISFNITTKDVINGK